MHNFGVRRGLNEASSVVYLYYDCDIAEQKGGYFKSDAYHVMYVNNICIVKQYMSDVDVSAVIMSS